MFIDAISYLRICRLSKSLRTKNLAVWESCFVPGEPPRTDLLGHYAQKEITASSDVKSIIKGSKTLPITQVDKVRCHGRPAPRPYRNPVKTHVFTDSCAEPECQTCSLQPRG